MNKVLFLSNTANFSKFNLPYMRWFHEQGRQVDYASAGEEDVQECDRQYKISIARSPFHVIKNLEALGQLKKNTCGKQLRHSSLPHSDGRSHRPSCRPEAPQGT